jgi:hypothetical protein
MRTLIARVDPALSARIVSVRTLGYSASATPDEDRPLHPRAASGLAWMGGRLLVIQDDAAFIATVAGDEVAAIALPRGVGARRRFEVRLGNKQHKLDLEACVAIGDEVWAFGSGSTAARDRIVRMGRAESIRIAEVTPLYDRVREAVGGLINIEGAACVGEELWLFHRGNTGPQDAGPAVIRFARAAVESSLSATGRTAPEPVGCVGFDLGEVEGVRLGFTDAVAVGERVYYLAVAEASPNAVDDGRICGSQLGVIDGQVVRAARLELEGAPIKAEGLAFATGGERRHAWISIDPDDVDAAAQLCEVELIGGW